MEDKLLAVIKEAQDKATINALREELARVNKLLTNQLEFNEMLKRNIRNLEAR